MGKTIRPPITIGCPAMGEKWGAAVVEIEAATTGDSLHAAKIASPAANAHLGLPSAPASQPPIPSFLTENKHVRHVAILLSANFGSGFDRGVVPGRSRPTVGGPLDAAEDSSATASQREGRREVGRCRSKDKDKESDADADTKSDNDEKAESKNGKPKNEAAVKDKKDSESIATDKDKDQVKADATAEKNSKPKSNRRKEGRKSPPRSAGDQR